MLPQDIKSAIPRQKVLKDGYAYNVLAINPDNTMILQLADLSQKNKAMQTWSYAKPEDCEPVHEESKPFRVGDKIAYELGPKARHDLIGLTQYAIVEGIQSDGRVLVCGTALRTKEDMPFLRHATPEEVAQYFN